MGPVILNLECGDIRETACDVLLLKHADSFYGADLAVARKLTRRGESLERLAPDTLQHRLVESSGKIGAQRVLFVGVGPLRRFGYAQMDQFARTGLALLARESEGCRHLALTIHGPGYGLDEVESLISLVNGCIAAIERQEAPTNLERITIIERNKNRALRLRLALEEHLRQASFTSRDGHGFKLSFANNQPAPPAQPQPVQKPHIFVAMPFSPELEDVFYYGIQQPVRANGFICERVDKSVFSGDIVARIKERIATSAAVIADLTGANANVYLEVGYAWGLDRPTILIVKSIEELCFDVRGSRCLEYRSIKQLEASLDRELKALL